jgi:hypothetical protein
MAIAKLLTMPQPETLISPLSRIRHIKGQVNIPQVAPASPGSSLTLASKPLAQEVTEYLQYVIAKGAHHCCSSATLVFFDRVAVLLAGVATFRKLFRIIPLLEDEGVELELNFARAIIG